MLVSGLVNIETTIKIKEFPINYFPIDYPFFGVNMNVSGVGINIAKAMHTLGDEINLFSFTGKDMESRMILTELEQSGIAADNISHTLKQTPASAVLYDETGRRQIYCDLKDIQEVSAQSEQVKCFEDNDLYILCNINFNRELIKKARSMGKITASDVHVLGDIHDTYNEDFMRYSDILFLSDENIPCEPEQFIKEIAQEYNNRIIVIGRGSKGAMLYDSQSRDVVSLEAVHMGEVVNTVGAGDALFSAFLHFYMKEQDARAALMKAQIFASIKIGCNGAAIGFADESRIEAEYALRGWLSERRK